MQHTTATVTGRFLGGALYSPKEEKFNCCLALDPGESAKIKGIIETAKNEKWGDKPPKGMQIWGVRIGDDPDFEHSYGNEFINPKCNTKAPPLTLAKRPGESIANHFDGIYAGCHVAVSVRAFAYDGGKDVRPGVSLALRAVLFTRDGDPIGDRFDPSEFDGFESELDASAFGDETESMM